MDKIEHFMDNKDRLHDNNWPNSPEDKKIGIKLEDIGAKEEFTNKNQFHNEKIYTGTTIEEGHNLVLIKTEDPNLPQIKEPTTPERRSKKVKTSNSNNNEIFTSEYELKFHKELDGKHPDPKRKTHKCPICNFVTPYKKNINRHVNSVHLDSKRYKCHICSYASYRRSTIQFHIDSFHLSGKRFACTLCEYTASLKSHLKVHIDSVHFKYKENQCHLCDHKANRKSDLRRHIESVHLKNKQFQCLLCDFSTSYKKNVDRHVENVHSK